MEKINDTDDGTFVKGWRREHEAFTDMVPRLENHIKLHPDDPWGPGQLKYVKRRLKWLESKLGLAQNR